jgi:hypothetical protein
MVRDSARSKTAKTNHRLPKQELFVIEDLHQSYQSSKEEEKEIEVEQREEDDHSATLPSHQYKNGDPLAFTIHYNQSNGSPLPQVEEISSGKHI